MPKDKTQPGRRPLQLMIVAGAFSLIILLNSFQFAQELTKIYKIKKIAPFSFAGLKFSGLEEVFNDVSVVGYYSDKDLEVTEHASQLAQAQLILAPTVLDVNNLDHEYLLFDCSSPQIALAKIKEIGAQALKKNQYGIILAKRNR